MNDPAHAMPVPACPRCDYDLSGETATWTVQCPLESRCPECGFDVRWTSIFRTATPPAWSVEHAAGSRWTVVASVFRSASRAFLPRHLWRKLSLSMPVVPKRLALMLVVWLVASYVMSMGLMAATIWVESWMETRVLINSYRGVAGFNPAAFTVKIETGRWLFPYFSTMSQWRGVPPEPMMLCVLFGLVMPGALVLMPMSLRRAKVRPRHIVRLTGYWLVWLSVLAIVPAWTDSLYRMTVQFRYQVSTPWIVETLKAILGVSNGIVTLILFAVVVWYWRAAAKHYLRIPRPGLVAVGLVGVASLLTLAVGYFLIPGADDIVTQIFYELSGR